MRRHPRHDMGARLFIKTPQNLPAAIIDGHIDPQAVEDAGKFRRDIATADNKRAFRQGGQVKHLV